MQKTSIQWTDMSANPFRARHNRTGKTGWHCTKVSPGCAACYAETLNGRFGTGLPFQARSTSEVEMILDLSVMEKLRRRKKPQKVFLADMTDAFGDWIPDDWLDQVFTFIAMSPQHTFQVLTKRPARMRRYFAERTLGDAYTTILRSADQEPAFADSPLDTIRGILRVLDSWEVRDGYQAKSPPPKAWPLPNLWMGTSVEDQEQARRRIRDLAHVPATVLFLSVEPLLEAVDLTRIDNVAGETYNALTAEVRTSRGRKFRTSDTQPISWVIVGGESGPRSKARPCNLAWLRSLRDQCRDAGVPCFLKQLGSRPFVDRNDEIGGGIHCHLPLKLKDHHGGDEAEWPEDLRGCREFPRPALATTGGPS